jgi:hypothetical protein
MGLTYMATRELAFWGGGAKGVATVLNHVVALESASAGRQGPGANVHMLTRSIGGIYLGVTST